MTIKDTVRNLAKQSGISINQLEKELGFSTGTIGKWDVVYPNAGRLLLVADYFGVTVDYLLGRETGTKKELPDLTPKDEREIANQLENMMNNLDDETAFAAVGGSVEDENDRQLLRASLEIALRLSKQIAQKNIEKSRDE